MVLGIGGGIVPCSDAIILLFLAIRMGRPWLAVPLLLAFSAGLASVLVVLGVVVVRAGAAARRRRPVARGARGAAPAWATAQGAGGGLQRHH